jgi:hypothetical protein
MGLLQFGHREHPQYGLPVVVTTFSGTLHTQPFRLPLAFAPLGNKRHHHQHAFSMTTSKSATRLPVGSLG